MSAVKVKVEVSGNAVEIVTEIGASVANRRGLNAALGDALESLLIDHFSAKGGRKFWGEIAAATAMDDSTLTDDGVTVVVAERRFNLHLYGGTVRPVEKKALTIPLHPMAEGKFVRELERERGLDIFRPNKKGGGKMNILAAVVGGQLVALYALAKSATIKRDPQALPPDSEISAALSAAARDYILQETLSAGGAA